jgi:VanZ family protein
MMDVPFAQRTRLFLNAFLPPVIWALVIFFLSNQATLVSFETNVLDFLFKKGAHMFVYAVFYVLLHRAISITVPNTPANTSHRFWLPIFLTVFYAVSDEIHQSFIPGRYPTVRDVGYDLLGMSIAFLRLYRYI